MKRNHKGGGTEKGGGRGGVIKKRESVLWTKLCSFIFSSHHWSVPKNLSLSDKKQKHLFHQPYLSFFGGTLLIFVVDNLVDTGETLTPLKGDVSVEELTKGGEGRGRGGKGGGVSAMGRGGGRKGGGGGRELPFVQAVGFFLLTSSPALMSLLAKISNLFSSK